MPVKKVIVLILCLFVCFKTSAQSNSVDVKYIGKVDIKEFTKLSIGSSSFVKEVYYHKIAKKMIVKLNDTFYIYCGVKDISFWDDVNASKAYIENLRGNKKLYCKRGK